MCLRESLCCLMRSERANESGTEKLCQCGKSSKRARDFGVISLPFFYFPITLVFMTRPWSPLDINFLWLLLAHTTHFFLFDSSGLIRPSHSWEHPHNPGLCVCEACEAVWAARQSIRYIEKIADSSLRVREREKRICRGLSRIRTTGSYDSRYQQWNKRATHEL